MKQEQQLFRKKSLDKISSPEQLNDYIRVANPSLWLVLGAVIALLVGVCIWGVLGKLDTTVAAVVTISNGQATAYVQEENIESIAEGNIVRINENEYTVTSVSQMPVMIDDDFSDYALYLMDWQKGEWVYTLTVDAALNEGVYAANIVVESVSPVSFVLN